ncbi:peptide ABC transporter substrate-binding protein [Erysipelothrix sp. HDW6B]|uniref:peptide ABC transporter substrate-binding protein n=1 Tax=Erysipelothrix TaxID=1647 RepID=UPI00135C47F5|nr:MULTISPECIES: peptide ABC transporter substrate-binding protein [Erysipelothrix]QIK85931.1 peptide ABC transporter substrate-binding protein [Erysipelothrix sp. HDW6B]
MKKIFALSLAVLLVLTGCGQSKGGGSAELSNKYSYVYSTDLNMLDYTVSMKATDGDHFGNFVDGLYENDPYGNFVPALAESHTVSDDGLVYTYKIRQGVKWVTNTGDEYAEVKAQDWVTGIEHAVAENSQSLPIVIGSIKGLAEYRENPALGIESVGMKALDDYTLEVTLNQPETFWQSKLVYGILYPINAEFLKNQGDAFGGADPSSILYNGPYVLVNNTAKSEIRYEKNKAYWDEKNVFLDEIKLIYDDGKKPDEFINRMEKGELTTARVYPNSPGYAQVKEKYADNIITSDTNGTTFYATFNVNRASYNHTSKTTDQEKADTQAAIQNRSFRQAIGHAFDRGSYNAQSVGDDLKSVALRNTLIPPTFVTVPGHDYGQLVTAEMQALDAELYKDFKIEDGHDALYNPEVAKGLIEKAKAELPGVTFPIRIDVPVLQTSEIQVNMAKSLKQSVETSLGTENVQIDLQLLDKDPYYNATYFAESGAQSDFDLSTASGWGPDYLDPMTYLNIFNSRNGDVLQVLGLDGSTNPNGNASSVDAIKAVRLAEFDALLDAAAAITDSPEARFKEFAKAEAWLNNEMLFIPIYAQGGTPSVTTTVPYSRTWGWSGLSTNRFKFMKVQKEPVTVAQRDEAKKAWDAERTKQN